MGAPPPGENAPQERDLLGAARARLAAGDTDGVKALLKGVPAPDVATILEDLDDYEQAAVFRLLDADSGADVLDELPPDDVQDLAEAAPARVRAAVEAMEPDEAVDVLQVLDDEQREALLKGLSAEWASATEKLRTYPPDSAGGLMTTEFVSLPWDVISTTGTRE